MKRFFILLLVVTGLGYLSLYAQSSKVQDKTESKALLVREMIKSKNYVINCNRIYPQRGQSRYVGSDYSIKIKGDTVRSYLPYIGIAHSVNYNGTNVFDFEKGYTRYTLKDGKKETLLVSFLVENENERLEYNLTIYPNGTVRVFIQPMKRDAVSYSGALEINNNK